MRRAAVLLAFLVGCSRGSTDGKTCRQVGARFYELAHAKVTVATDVTASERKAVIGLLAPMRDSMVRACTDDRWAAPARACFAGAADQATFSACEAQLSAEQRAMLTKRAAGQ
jgi:hypothetical protein